MTDDEKQILQILRNQEAAIKGGDAELAVAPIAEDVVTYDLAPPLEYRGSGQAAVEGFKDWFATWTNGVEVEMRDPKVLIDGGLAIAFGLSRMQGEKKDSGRLDQWYRRTVVLRRHDGKWTIVHEHSSFPMRMDGSGVAATDLTP